MNAFKEGFLAGIRRFLHLDIYDKQFLLGAMAGYFLGGMVRYDVGNVPYQVLDGIIGFLFMGWALRVEYKDRKKRGTLAGWKSGSPE